MEHTHASDGGFAHLLAMQHLIECVRPRFRRLGASMFGPALPFDPLHGLWPGGPEQRRQVRIADELCAAEIRIVAAFRVDQLPQGKGVLNSLRLSAEIAAILVRE